MSVLPGPTPPEPTPPDPTFEDRTPLAVDLDGTLICADLVRRGLAQLAARRPGRCLTILSLMARDRAAAKRRLAAAAPVDPAALPYDGAVVALIKEARSAGRPVLLVSGSDQAWVSAVAGHVGLFDAAIGSDGVVNLTGLRKATYLSGRFGRGGYDYVGNAWPDMQVWAQARAVVVTKPEWGLWRAARRRFATARRLPRGERWRVP